MKEHQRFPEPIITPTTKATEGHDEDITKDEIIRKGLVTKENMRSWKNTPKRISGEAPKWAAENGDPRRYKIRIRKKRW